MKNGLWNYLIIQMFQKCNGDETRSYNKGIWVAKKRYMLNVLDEEGIRLSELKLKLMGIEALNHLPGL